jgi:peptidoglycan/LPS O-acetylase OafA/YrhL
MTEKLTFLRFPAAISVVILHYGANAHPFNTGYIHTLFRGGYTAVSFFFLLSGFILVQAYGNKTRVNFLEFIAKRLARLYPLYILSFLLYVSKLHVSMNSNSNEGELSRILNIFMLQSWFPDMALTFNGPGWSLSCEMFFYLLFPALLFYFNKHHRYYYLYAILFFITSQITFQFLCNKYSDNEMATRFLYYSPTFHIGTFILGTVFGLLFKSNSLEFIKKNSDILLSLSAILILIGLIFPIPKLVIHNGIYSPLYALFIISVCYSKKMNFLKHKFLQTLGEISYAVYIVQFPVHLIFKDHISFNSNTITFYVYIIILIGVSVLFYYFIEKPIRSTVRKFFTQKNA